MLRFTQTSVFLIFLGFSLICMPLTLSAQEPYILSRISGTVILDGLSDEDAWDDIEPLTMIMHQPVFGNQPTERTEILIAFDNEYLYTAGRLYDKDPSKIQVTTMKRDDIKWNSDLFGIILDSFNDKENGIAFFTNPSGLRLDLAIFKDAVGGMQPDQMPFNISWNTFWDVETVQNDEGWFVEMRIPLSSIRFQTKDGRTIMGLIVWRWIPHKNELLTFPAIPPRWGMLSTWKPSKAREIVLENVQSHKPFYVAPYLLGGLGQSFELDSIVNTYECIDDQTFELGIDVKYGLTSNLTLDVTLNTDFAQVEADDEQVNLTRFDLFFPEKRLFFQERSSNFDFNFGGPNRLFYSRRIGIYDRKPVRIYGGARIVGRVGPWDIGFLSMQTKAIEELPSENYSVLRIRRQVINPNTYVGGILTSRMGMDGTYNTAYGLDGIFRISGDDYLEFNWAQTFENNAENNPVSLDPARIGISWDRRNQEGLGFNLSYSRSGESFNPGMGFEMRSNYNRIGNRILYGWRPGEESFLLRHNIFISGSLVNRNADDLTESAEVGPGWEFETKSSCIGNIQALYYYEDVPDTFYLTSNEVEVPSGKYKFKGLKGLFSTPMSGVFITMLNFEVGSFYDGTRVSLNLMPQWSISSHLELGGTYEFNRVMFPDRDQTLNAHIGRLRVLLSLNSKLSFTTFVQYNSAVNAIITNVRFRYNPREGNDLYLVYNEGMNTNRYSEVPNLPFTSNRTLLLKYTYTFNL